MNYLGCGGECEEGISGLAEFGLGAPLTRAQRLKRQQQRKDQRQLRSGERKEARLTKQLERKEARIQKRLANGKVAVIDPRESATIDKINAQLLAAKQKNTELRQKLSALKAQPPRGKKIVRRRGVSGLGEFGLGDDQSDAAGSAANLLAQQQASVAAAKQQAQFEKVCRNPNSMKCLILTLTQQSQQQMAILLALMQQIMDQNAALEEQILELLQQGYGGAGAGLVDESGNPVDVNGNPLPGGSYQAQPPYYENAGQPYQGPTGYPGQPGGGGFQPQPMYYDQQQYDQPYDEGGEIRGDAVPVSATPDSAGPYPLDSGFRPSSLDVAASFNDSGDQSDGFDVGTINAGLPMVESFAEGHSDDYDAGQYEDVGDLSGLFGHSRE